MVVVLPTPPFWLATASTRGRSRFRRGLWDTVSSRSDASWAMGPVRPRPTGSGDGVASSTFVSVTVTSAVCARHGSVSALSDKRLAIARRHEICHLAGRFGVRFAFAVWNDRLGGRSFSGGLRRVNFAMAVGCGQLSSTCLELFLRWLVRSLDPRGTGSR